MEYLPNISRNKGNQKMKFGQLIEYNIRNTFLKIHAHYEVMKLAIKFVLVVYASRGLPKYVKTKVLTTCFYLT